MCVCVCHATARLSIHICCDTSEWPRPASPCVPSVEQSLGCGHPRDCFRARRRVALRRVWTVSGRRGRAFGPRRGRSSSVPGSPACARAAWCQRVSDTPVTRRENSIPAWSPPLTLPLKGHVRARMPWRAPGARGRGLVARARVHAPCLPCGRRVVAGARLLPGEGAPSLRRSDCVRCAG